MATKQENTMKKELLLTNDSYRQLKLRLELGITIFPHGA